MSYDELIFSVIGYISFLLLLFAAVFSYKLFKFNRKEVSWLSIYLSIISLLVFQFLFFQETYNIDALGAENKKPLSYVLFLITSFMLAWGFWAMNKSFERFEVFGDVARSKIRGFLQTLEHKEGKVIVGKKKKEKRE